MASYLLQPDGSDTCCTCPDRVSPCDDCGTSCPPADTTTIQITFADILICDPFTDISVNGTFTLTKTGDQWIGAGGQFFFPDFGPVDTEITVGCIDNVLNIDYRGGGFALFVVISVTPPPPPVDNIIIDCSGVDDGEIGYLGTATLIF